MISISSSNKSGLSQIYRHPLVLIRGTASDLSGRTIAREVRIRVTLKPSNFNQVANHDGDRQSINKPECIQNIVTLSKSGQFQLLIHFKQPWMYYYKWDLVGLPCRGPSNMKTTTIHYRGPNGAGPPEGRFVRLVYVLCRTDDGMGTFDDGRFQCPPEESAPGSNSEQSARKRISTSMLAIQTFYAQSLNLASSSSSSQVFQLELDSNHLPVVHLFRLKQSVSELWQLTQEELWNLMCQELSASELYIPNRVKFVAFLSFTRYSASCSDTSKPTQARQQLMVSPKSLLNGSTKTQQSEYRAMLDRCKAYASIGGPLVTLIGTPCLWAWPDSVSSVLDALQDSRSLPDDRDSVMNDSRGRNTRGGIYATGLGALAHELGHTFDLGHYSSGIMSRDCDFINEFFVGHNSISTSATRSSSRQETSVSSIKWWPKAAQLILAHHKWFLSNPSEQSSSSTAPDSVFGPPIQISSQNQSISSSSSIIITAAAGIILIEGRTKSGRVAFERVFQPAAPPKRITLPTGFLILNKKINNKMAPRQNYHQAQSDNQDNSDRVYELFIMDTEGNVLKPDLDTLDSLLHHKQDFSDSSMS